ncbi:hypothetical protein [Bosea sp. ANAM02]|uniref:hypothetical protein n=1 Tax=Bosea sp. ANAM02 TaxID=2020412 RepID=UPI00140F0EBB|nr:hypothetical protein [Bosea sp. ANAM02]BCB22455.1 hypothetical protein OCUBac02_53490 [Bosea sp. ANAM02]
MSNPFEKAASALVGRLDLIADEERRAKAAADAERQEKERSFSNATALFAAAEARVDQCLRQANEAFKGSRATLTKKVVPLSKATAGTITVSLSDSGKQLASFRIVGNSSFKLYVHELIDPKYGPFDLADADALPYVEMINQFIISVTEKVAG